MRSSILTRFVQGTKQARIYREIKKRAFDRDQLNGDPYAFSTKLQEAIERIPDDILFGELVDRIFGDRPR